MTFGDGPDSFGPDLVNVGPSPGAPGPCLVWRFPHVLRAISSAVVGGGLGPASWAINLTVDADYARHDPVQHLEEIVERLGLAGRGVAIMTAVAVGSFTSTRCGGVAVETTVGVRRPMWAANPDRLPSNPASPGTINVVARLPNRLTDAAMVNAVATITEAKAQALFDHDIPGTGTASDAVCVLCPAAGDADPFGGPRSTWGGRLAQATYDAIAAGILRQRG